MKKAVMTGLLLLTVMTGVQSAPVFANEAETASEAKTDAVADESERASQTAVGEEGDVPIYPEAVKDGDYEIEVESSSSMFRIVACTLHVAEDSMTADMTLSGKGYLRLYMGTGEEAVKADASKYAEFTENDEGQYVYTVPVEALDKALECTGFSKRKEKWYDHQVSFRSEHIPEEAIDLTKLTEEDAEEEAEEAAADEPEAKAVEAETESEAAKTEPAAEAAAEPEAAEEKEELPVLTQQTIALSDGDYETEAVLSGGSGRASIESPVRVKVASGLATAHIRWSSPNYDYMIVNGETYLPVNKAGENSEFEIPVLAFDQPFVVIADTTAMSQPHEITYELTFSLSGMKKGANLMQNPILPILCILAVVVVVVLITRIRRNIRKQ